MNVYITCFAGQDKAILCVKFPPKPYQETPFPLPITSALITFPLQTDVKRRNLIFSGDIRIDSKMPWSCYDPYVEYINS